MRRTTRRLLAATAALGVSTLATVTPEAEAAPPAVITGFDHLVQHEVSGEVAEIVAATPDGRTLVYTDSEEEEVGFVDIVPAGAPEELGTTGVDGSPTSVAVTPNGQWALVGVSGDPDELTVLDTDTRAEETSLPLPGQPDSIAISANGRYAAIAIENERDEEVDEGAMPQLPAGLLVIVDLQGPPAGWGMRNVTLTGIADRFPEDPEPEFVDIRKGIAALTLQENNHVVLIELASGTVIRDFPVGTTTHAADLTNDGTVSFTETLTDARLEPDAIHWTPGAGYTANEGDYDVDLGPGQFIGGRNFSLFGAGGGLRFDAGSSLEEATADAGFYNDGRSDDNGTEPEGIEIATFGRTTFLFVGMERANAVAVYRLEGANELPVLVEVLGTGDRPEGLLAIPHRRLFVSANEDDGTIDIYRGHVGPA